jgi:hypothetical protein
MAVQNSDCQTIDSSSNSSNSNSTNTSSINKQKIGYTNKREKSTIFFLLIPDDLSFKLEKNVIS